MLESVIFRFPIKVNMRKKLAQHFLTNRAVIKKIIAAIDPQKGEVIIEIGSGHGELTLPLAGVCARTGCRVIAIEKDLGLAKALELRIQDLKENVQIVHADAIKFIPSIPKSYVPSSSARGARLPDGQGSAFGGESYKLVGNIPYYITGYLFRVLGELEKKPLRCVFMVQKEVAERLVREPHQMNRFAASVQFWAEIKMLRTVPRENFSPPPRVDSAIVKLETRGERKGIAGEEYYRAVRIIFQQPRKTISNNLRSGYKKEKNLVLDTLKKIGLRGDIRPQNLSVEDILRIASSFRE